jgi:hypothetical protein
MEKEEKEYIEFFKPKFYGKRIEQLKLSKRLKKLEKKLTPFYIFIWILIFLFGTLVLPKITGIDWLFMYSPHFCLVQF